MRTLEEAILHAEEVANDYEGMIGDYALDSGFRKIGEVRGGAPTDRHMA